MRADLLITDISSLYTLQSTPDEPLGLRRDTSIAFSEGKVCWMGPAVHAPGAESVLDGRGLVGLPGLVDPHTHAVWAGSRAGEFERRLAGATYSEILESGGGINATVQATRRASRAELAASCRARLRALRARGVTSVEIKSGYGLEPDTEARMLAAAVDCADTVRVIPTFLGAHTFPGELRHDRAAYVAQIIEEQIPLCATLAEAIDVYCDRGAFTLEESIAILEAGRAAGLKVRAHAEQVAHTGIAAAAARLGATCVDHLERLDDEGVAAMAEHGTVAVLLPGAQLYLKDAAPPVGELREAGVPLALGTDLNPGSSPVHDPWIIATLACLLQGFTVVEAILGLTRNAGRALGRPELGWLGEGSVGDLALFYPPPGEPPTAAVLVQQMGGRRLAALVQSGRCTLRR